MATSNPSDSRWQDIGGFEDHYRVSDDGRVWSCRRDREMVGGDNGRGYVSFRLCLDRVKHVRYIHRLVAEAFVPNPDGHTEVNHKDGNKLNNHWTNLEWCSRQRNCQHALDRGLRVPVCGSRVKASKLTESTVAEMRFLWATGQYRQSDLGALYGVKERCVYEVVKRRSWKHVL